MPHSVSQDDFAAIALRERVCRTRRIFSHAPPPGGHTDAEAWTALLEVRARTPLEVAYRLADLLMAADSVGPSAELVVGETCDVIDGLLDPGCDPLAAAAKIDGLALRAERVGFGTEELGVSARDLREMAQASALLAA